MRNRILTLLLLLISTSVFAQNIDIRILRSVYSPHDLKSDPFMKFVSNSNNYMVVGIPITVGIVGLIKHDEKWINSACQIVVANAINLGATYTLKYTINRDRPFLTYPDIRNKVNEDSPSFPSGHTSSAFATATSLSLAFPKWYVIVPSYMWAGTVGYSRMQLGVHYPGDVLGGMITGAGSAYLTYKLNKWINKSYARKHE
ncbi:MAG: phosphatase PAP2 family protein [Prolixibacteraceae bacterium]|nr:phosphatase PAP2 family protein [Prolixibacteraceae bacterium]